MSRPTWSPPRRPARRSPHSIASSGARNNGFLDPPDDGRATLGGVAATGLGGAQALAYGSPRAHVIGMRVLLADGRLIKAGGRVVKNVAGYDLCKLFVGSYGTLGLITELTFKLRPRPAREATVMMRSEGAHALFEIARSIAARRLLPVAVELLSPAVAREVGAAPADNFDYALAVRFAGTTEAIDDQCGTLRDLARQTAGIASTEITASDEHLWRALAALSTRRAGALQWRAQVKPTLLPEVAAMLNQGDFGRGVAWHAGLGDGKLRVRVDAQNESAHLSARTNAVRQAIVQKKGSLVIESVPDNWSAEEFAMWGDVGATLPLMKRITRQLDPENCFPSGGF
ncbi:MAG: FAD-binding oxidoreductase [Pyrinomonadaceae bacterium]